ncbi:hypothetical protein KCE64_002092 [Salmonella enterica subsp. enterica serovar Hvittingfoss]|nr:hypothetical protein [Salmonella enterica subsp. enterica serovar Hvittingfoss]EHL2849698.1 hypothetical protein [Salmonella enterica subsp. enterica serovar Hvittingfoss]
MKTDQQSGQERRGEHCALLLDVVFLIFTNLVVELMSIIRGGNNIPILNNDLYFYFLWLLDGVR